MGCCVKRSLGQEDGECVLQLGFAHRERRLDSIVLPRPVHSTISSATRDAISLTRRDSVADCRLCLAWHASTSRRPSAGGRRRCVSCASVGRAGHGTRDTVVAAIVSDSEVVTRAAAIFDGVPAATPSSGPMAPDARATWDIDVRSYETHEMVAQYVGIFTGRGKQYMERGMSRGTRYDAMLRRKFRESGLPEDMTYLALIESSYLPHAYSKAAAVGMWQFMAPTARGIGMRVDWWVDERRDPMRATDGAIDFLTDLHDAYGSWYLAAAAYNGGPGRVSRGLKRFSEAMDGSEGEDRFFALAEQRYLPSETKAYVPKLIAAAMVAKEPARYGLRVDTLPAFEYDSVNVVGGTPWARLRRPRVSGSTSSGISIRTSCAV